MRVYVAVAVALLSVPGSATAARPISRGHYEVTGSTVDAGTLHAFRHGDAFTEDSSIRVHYAWRCANGRADPSQYGLDLFFDLHKTTWDYTGHEKPPAWWEPLPPLKIDRSGSFSAIRTEPALRSRTRSEAGTQTLSISGRFVTRRTIKGWISTRYTGRVYPVNSDRVEHLTCTTRRAPFRAVYDPRWKHD